MRGSQTISKRPNLLYSRGSSVKAPRNRNLEKLQKEKEKEELENKSTQTRQKLKNLEKQLDKHISEGDYCNNASVFLGEVVYQRGITKSTPKRTVAKLTQKTLEGMSDYGNIYVNPKDISKLLRELNHVAQNLMNSPLNKLDIHEQEFVLKELDLILRDKEKTCNKKREKTQEKWNKLFEVKKELDDKINGLEQELQ